MPPALPSRERGPDEAIKGIEATTTTARALPPPKDDQSGRAYLLVRISGQSRNRAAPKLRE